MGWKVGMSWDSETRTDGIYIRKEFSRPELRFEANWPRDADNETIAMALHRMADELADHGADIHASPAVDPEEARVADLFAEPEE